MAPRVALRLSCLVASAAAAPGLFGGGWQTLRKSQAADAEKIDIVGTAGLAPYPDYTGNLTMTGDILMAVVAPSPQLESELRLVFTLFDADPSCAEGVSRIRVAGSCSISVHTGDKCEEAGEAFSIHSTLPHVAYTSVNKSAAAMVTAKLGQGESGTLGAFAGRTVVVRDAAGTAVACAPLRRMQVSDPEHPSLVQDWQLYPGYEGELRVTGMAGMLDLTVEGEAGQLFLAQVAGADPECASGRRTGIANSCGIHVHEGRTCTDAAAVGGHLFHSMGTDGEDPWAPIRYITEAQSITHQTAMTGLALSEIEGRALVVHDATGARIACALVPSRSPSEGDDL